MGGRNGIFVAVGCGGALPGTTEVWDGDTTVARDGATAGVTMGGVAGYPRGGRNGTFVGVGRAPAGAGIWAGAGCGALAGGRVVADGGELVRAGATDRGIGGGAAGSGGRNGIFVAVGSTETAVSVAENEARAELPTIPGQETPATPTSTPRTNAVATYRA